MPSLSRIAKTIVFCITAAGITGCGGNSSTGTTTTGGGTTSVGATSVYVIQNPVTFGNGSASILQFSATASGTVSPLATITGPTNTSMNGLATDGAGNIYVSYYGPTNSGGILEYAAAATGAATPVRSLKASSTTGVTAVDGLTTSTAGEIFVAEDYGGVQAFSQAATGDVAPARRILGAYESGGGLSTIGTAYGIASDSPDNLYVINEGYAGGQPLLVFGPTATGNVTPVYSIGGALTGLTMGSVLGVTTDSAGNVYVTTEVATGGASPVFTGSILEFAAGAKGNVAPIRTISGPLTLLHVVAGIKVDSVGNIFVLSASPTSTAISPMILKFSATASGNTSPISTFTSTSWTNPDNSGSLAIQ